MKSKEFNIKLNGLSIEELNEKLKAEQDNLGKLNFAHAISPIENPMKIRQSRKLIARLQTELRAKELAK